MFTESNIAEYSQLYGSSSAFCCPSQELPPRTRDEELIDDQSYFYLPHVVLDDIRGKRYAEALRALMSERAEIAFNIEVPNGYGSNKKDELLRADQGVARHFVEYSNIPDYDMQKAVHAAVDAQIPIIVEWPSHHPEPGSHVLYLDGHVEFLKYPGPFPMTEHFIEAMRQLDQLSPEIETKQ
jgi:prepilin-type processing-associated H-X9-DG protein